MPASRTRKLRINPPPRCEPAIVEIISAIRQLSFPGDLWGSTPRFCSDFEEPVPSKPFVFSKSSINIRLLFVPPHPPPPTPPLLAPCLTPTTRDSPIYPQQSNTCRT